MTDQIKQILDNESLSTLLRSNLCCYMGKTMTKDSLEEITTQIVESISFLLNKPEDKL